MTDADLMRLAIEKAREGIRQGQTPFGACIARAGEVLSCTHNVVWQTTDITAHAEIYAIREACRKLNTIDLCGCVIFSTCEPCPMCFAACHWAKISKIALRRYHSGCATVGLSRAHHPGDAHEGAWGQSSGDRRRFFARRSRRTF